MQEFEFQYEKFLDRTTLLYGASGSGKSTVMVDILHTLKPHIDQVLVISPTDRQNHTYDNGLIPLPFIHYNITGQLLDKLWERQEGLVQVYTKANNIKVLYMLFNRIREKSDAVEAINSVNRKLAKFKEEIAEEETDVNIINFKSAEMTKKCNNFIMLILKKTINENYSQLQKTSGLSAEEAYTLKYLNLNPRIVVIFDDCTDLLKKFKTHPVMQKLFYQGRWSYITALIACHTDKALDPELKKNAFISIFTENKCANSFFERGSNDFDKEGKQIAHSAIKQAFVPTNKYQKLVYMRTEDKFYKFTSRIRPGFEFGSSEVREYSDRAKIASGTAATDNPFFHQFK